MANGAAAVAEAARAARAAFNASLARHELRRARRAARPRGERTEHRADFECLYLCTDCNYLGDGVGDCPGCGERSWLDLRKSRVADALRDMEDEAQRLANYRSMRIAILASLPAALVPTELMMLGLRLWLDELTYRAHFELGMALAFMLSWLACAVILAAMLRPRPKEVARWHRAPLPAKGSARSAVAFRGRAAARRGGVLAPFSGRSCLAYHVMVRLAAGAGRGARGWLLDESRAVDIDVGARALVGARLRFSGRLLRIDPASRGLSRQALQTFFRRRGLNLGEDDYELYEAVLEQGEEVCGRLHENGTAELRPARLSAGQAEGQLALAGTGLGGGLAEVEHSGALALQPGFGRGR